MAFIVLFVLMCIAAWVAYDIGNDETKTPK
jgi:hypothetical protein